MNGQPTRRTIYPVLLEHQAKDGEWEPVSRGTLTISDPDAWTREDTWAAVEEQLLRQAGLTRRMIEGYAAPAPGPNGTPWMPGWGRMRSS